MKLITTALLAILSISSAFAATPSKVQPTTYHIRQSVLSGAAFCSATAIGPHALITATHCEQPTDSIDIQGFPDSEVTVVSRIRDEQDHTILLLKGIEFKDFANINETYSLQQGDEVFMFGNPGNWANIFRKGYYAGRTNEGSPFNKEPDELLFDINIGHGDSGAALFNSNGDIVALVTGIIPDSDRANALQLSFAFPLGFTPSDLTKAKTF
jgi:V8-like Glu-specific endopeptidase